MSKRKNPDSTETEMDAAENIAEQSEFERISSPAEEAVESKPESPVASVATQLKAEPIVSVKTNKAGKIGLAKFLMLYPQDAYTETLLKHYYQKSVFTKDEWFQRIEDIRNTPIYN